MKKKVLVTGSNGQVGYEIQKLYFNYTEEYEFLFVDKIKLDITDFEKTNLHILDNKIDIIINCAAYTNVNGAESDIKNADLINNKAVENLAKTSKKYKIKFIHISTDYVFDGKNNKPYVENDNVCANSVYGKTKLKGEQSIFSIMPINSIIIRTSWVYSSHGNNFVKSMLKLGKTRSTLNVVFDQIGTPTYARDLAKLILDILPYINNSEVEVYHYTNEGALSWYDFAQDIMEISQIACKILPIESKDYPMSEIRPLYTLLNKEKIKNEFNVKIPYYRDSLKECLKKLGES